MAVKKKAVISAAKDLNKVMGLEPRIDVKADVEEIIEKILEAAEWIEEDDEISKETRATIEALQAEQSDEDEGDVADEENFEETIEADEENFEEEEKVAPPAPVKSKKEKSPKGKTDSTSGKGNARKVGPRKFGETFTRAMAAGSVMLSAKSPITVDEVAKQSDALYVKKTKNASNLKEARWATTVALQALIGYGVVEHKDGLLTNK